MSTHSSLPGVNTSDNAPRKLRTFVSQTVFCYRNATNGTPNGCTCDCQVTI